MLNNHPMRSMYTCLCRIENMHASVTKYHDELFVIFSSAIGQDVMTPLDPPAVTFIASFPAGPPSDSECVTYTILDDNELEGDHHFVVHIDGVPSNVTIGTPSTTTVIITDDDCE